MKYFIIFFIASSFLLLSGCQKQIPTSPEVTIITGTQANPTTGLPQDDDVVISSVSIATENNAPLQGTIGDGLQISGYRYNVSLKDAILTYSGFFSIEIPEKLRTRDYQNGSFEMLSFSSNDSEYKNFSISIGEDMIGSESIDDETFCLQGYKDFGQTRKSLTTESKQVNSITLYITTAISEDALHNNMQVCFRRNGVLHKIGIGNYNIPYMNTIVDSLRFF